MRLAILGSGSLGSLYAALLSRVEGVELFVHGRGTHGAHMVAEGLHLEGESEYFVSNVDVFFSLDEVGLPPVALGTVDYVLLNKIIKKEMSVPSKLLEHVANRILDSAFKSDNRIQKGIVKISKINPPINGDVQRVSIKLSRKK